MLRIRHDCLYSGADGLLHAAAGQPFSGLAYRLDARGRLAEILAVDAGAITGPSTDRIELPAGGERVAYDILDCDDGPCLLEGVPFAGVAYTFEDDGHCSAEMLYAGGFATETAGREWYPDGAPERLLDPVGTVTEWLEDGTLEAYSVGRELRYGITLGDDGRVGVLTLADPSLFDPQVFDRLGFDDEVWLIGPAIDAGVVTALGGLRHVRALRLIRTGMAPAGLAALTALPALRDLRLQENPALGAREAAALAAARDDWTVCLDRVVIPGVAPSP